MESIHKSKAEKARETTHSGQFESKGSKNKANMERKSSRRNSLAVTDLPFEFEYIVTVVFKLHECNRTIEGKKTPNLVTCLKRHTKLWFSKAGCIILVFWFLVF